MHDYKTCSKCSQLLPVIHFNKFVRSKDGLAVWCKNCNKSYQKQHRIKNLDRYKSDAKARRLSNQEYNKSYNSLYYKINKERLSQENAAWRDANKNRKKELDKKWANANKDKVQVYQTNWRLRNPEKASLFRQIRRARLKDAKLFLVTAKNIKRLMQQNCIYCGCPSSQVDHIIPLSRGGLHSIGNLAASCKPCNLSKSNKMIMEWRVWKLRLESDV
jgi:5-methylcytosine-specific restriction endonuclease McrA